MLLELPIISPVSGVWGGCHFRMTWGIREATHSWPLSLGAATAGVMIGMLILGRLTSYRS